jgi:DNA-binding CsgD family transcriptional regulator
MPSLSHVLTKMYDLAERTPMHAFSRGLLEILKSVVPFDGATLGVGSIAMPGRKRNETQLSVRLLDDCAVISDVGAPALCNSLRRLSSTGRSRPVCSDCCCGCNNEPQQHQATPQRELLLYAPANNSDGAYWLALCRGNGQRFVGDDRNYLNAVWPHMVRSLEMSRQRFLDRQVQHFERRGAAVVTANGSIDIADPYFMELVSAEWPGFAGTELPPEAMDAWHRSRSYRGTKIEIRFREQDGCLLCVVRPHAVLDGLTKTEGIVARHFASGLSHREVAQTLGVSENTVRTHLKQAYSKLGVHDKAQLANRIGSAAR